MNQLSLLKDRLKGVKTHLQEKQGELNIINQSIQEKELEKEVLMNNNERILLKKKLIEDSCSEARENGRELLSEISTSLIQSIFNEKTKVNLNIELKDGIPNADVSVLNEYEDGIAEVDPSRNDGGGLADVVALSLFMAIGQTVDDNYAPYVLDEPSKFVSKGILSERFAESFKELVDYTGKQTIISTHDEFLKETGETIYNISKDWETGISIVEKVDY
ncbi:hypothetical protein [Clostridium disporicum]|mgnify:CR=1 FL=1|uniref:hypothetical protein n=1 Tax=Clostridium disporicum TaxID=84024 RepID=UPI0034A2FD98